MAAYNVAQNVTGPDGQITPEAQAVMRTAAPIVKPLLQIGGTIGGGIGGQGAIPVPVAGALIGGGLGYAGANRLNAAYETAAGMREPEKLGEALINTAYDIPTGALMEATGMVGGKIIGAGLGQVGKLAPKLYESALRSIPRAISPLKRQQAVATALENKIAPTQKGFMKLRDMIDEINDKISGIIDDAVKKGGKNSTIETSKILSRLDKVKAKVTKENAAPKELIDFINSEKDKILAQRGKTIGVAEAQALKKGLYRKLSDKAYAQDTKLTTAKDIDKAVARGIKEELADKFPQLDKLNKNDSALINLNKVIEKTAEAKQRALMSLGDIGASGVGGVAGGGKGAVIAGVVNKIINAPGVMARVAFALNKASKATPSKFFTRTLAYPGATAARKKMEEKDLLGKTLGLGAKEASAMELPGIADDQKKEVSLEQLGTQAYLNDKPREAIKFFRKAILENPGKKQQYINSINKIQALKKAKDNFGKMGKDDYMKSIRPSSGVSPTIRRATNAYRQGNYDNALKGFRRAIELDPQRKPQYQAAIDKILREKKAMNKYYVSK